MKIFPFGSTWRHKGFTFIELMTAMAIGSLLLILFLTILSMAVKTTESLGDDHLLSRQYALSLMEREINHGEKIYDIRQWHNVHPGNLGFMIQGPSYQGEGVVYIYYYESRNHLYRTAVNLNKALEQPERYPFFTGSSRLCDNTEIQWEFSPKTRSFAIELSGKPSVRGFIYIDGLEWEDDQ
ncbi:MAG: prepilin-type N-terminal cleavage/methylation domain-containing protein [Tissierellia bacterium]|nr:prepilin-type N-terminal cleavage/methylation domain-containing protein [Tissierellia bacterium]